MKIAVCLKQVPSVSKVRIDPVTRTIVREGYESVINPFDSCALEEALRLREKTGMEVIAISMGPSSAQLMLRDALAVGADRAILLNDSSFAGSDTWATSYILSLAVRKTGAELVFCGRQAIDGDTAQVAPGIAAHLGWHQALCVSGIDYLNIDRKSLAVNRMHEDSFDLAEISFPAVISVVKEINTPRLSNLREKLEAREKIIEIWGRESLGIPAGKTGLAGSPTKVVKIFPPPPRGGDAMRLEGEPLYLAEKLYDILAGKKVFAWRRAFRERGPESSEGEAIASSYEGRPFPAAETCFHRHNASVSEPALTADGEGISGVTFRPGDKPEPGGIWVMGETAGGRLHQAVFELLGKAFELAHSFGSASSPAGTAGRRQVALVCAGSFEGDMSFLGNACADVAMVVDDARLSGLQDEAEAAVLAHLAGKYRPDIILSGATSRGRAIMPRAAVALNAGLTADCTSLEIDPESLSLVQTRPAFGGNILASILTDKERYPQMATVRPGVFKKYKVSLRTRAAARPVPCVLSEAIPEICFDKLKIVHKAEERKNPLTRSISDSAFIIAGGRGMKDKSGFALLHQLASLTGGAVGASRAAVDSGLATYECQIGQTGRTVEPDVYLACGISGQIQHMAGMQSSHFIIAINRDRNAPVMKMADVAITGQAEAILAELIRLIEGKTNPAINHAAGGTGGVN